LWCRRSGVYRVADRAINRQAGAERESQGRRQAGRRGHIGGARASRGVDQAGGGAVAIALLEFLEDIDAELHALADGELADHGGEVNLQRFAIQLVDHVVDA